MLKLEKIRFNELAITLVLCILIFLIHKLELFGDESFYWLEGQFLDWSYAELPGWTAWMIRLGTLIFGDHNFAVRILGFVSFISACLALVKIHQVNQKPNLQKALLFIFSVPLFFIISILALPDVWMICFVAWIIYFFHRIQKQQKSKDYLILGILVALSINVHIRMWLWVLISTVCWMLIYQKQFLTFKKIFYITVPIAIIGLIPILIFNLKHGFPLLQFQLSDRQPWEFQVKNFSLLLSQILIITPPFFYLWFKNLFRVSNDLLIKWVQWTSLCHFVLYVILGFFADGLRSNFHWLAISYFPVMILVVVTHESKTKVFNLSILAGYLTTIIFAFYLVNSNSYFSSKVIQNSSDWENLNKEVVKQMEVHNVDLLINDYFMTTSELAFLQSKTKNIHSMSHDLNRKHGREKQLEINGLLIPYDTKINKQAIFVVESTAIKLENQGKYWSQICQRVKSMKHLQTLNFLKSKKQYYIFLLNQSDKCQIPPVYYLEHKQNGNSINFSGWVLWKDRVIEKIQIVDKMGSTYEVKTQKLLNSVYPELNQPQQTMNQFELNLTASDSLLQIMIHDEFGNLEKSKYFYID